MTDRIDDYLQEQSNLTAVEEFTLKHDLKQFQAGQTHFRELIPKKTPGPGQQYAFEVNLDQCTGCKSCVSACHAENGLDEDEMWRSVGLIQGGTAAEPALQHITSACHHCMEPACMNGCPTKAYEKDPVTGIVKHLEDQCFGCQYCILKCPYDVPKYNKKKGIVHKCDMCISRLEVGQAPACVRACPTSAIRITLIDTAEVIKNPDEFVNIPDAPSSAYTLPTTRYTTVRRFPANMVSLDYFNIQPEHSHFPLVLMLVLTQLSVGAFGAQLVAQHMLPAALNALLYPLQVLIALGIGLLALGASVCHLGRPLYAFRAILGWETSWLSREIIVFGLFAQLAVLYALCSWFPSARGFLERFGAQTFDVIGYLVLIFGLLGVYCSVKVYKDTKRPFWDNEMTTFKFFMTTLMLGPALILTIASLYTSFSDQVALTDVWAAVAYPLCLTIAVTGAAKLLLEAAIFLTLAQPEMTFFKKSAILMTRQLKTATTYRFVCGAAGAVLMPVILMNVAATGWAVALTVLMFALILGGELLERYLFFRAVVPLKMPGGSLS